MSDITNVSEKVRAFRQDHPATEIALLTSFVEDEVGGIPRVIGHCQAVLVETGSLLAEAFGTRALRAPIPNRQGHQDTRDPDRAMTQAVGRCLGLMGYADGESLEGNTDEPDSSNVSESPRTRSERSEPTTRTHVPPTPSVASSGDKTAGGGGAGVRGSAQDPAPLSSNDDTIVMPQVQSEVDLIAKYGQARVLKEARRIAMERRSRQIDEFVPATTRDLGDVSQDVLDEVTLALAGVLPVGS